jgi:hypothetical protein
VVALKVGDIDSEPHQPLREFGSEPQCQCAIAEYRRLDPYGTGDKFAI